MFIPILVKNYILPFCIAVKRALLNTLNYLATQFSLYRIFKTKSGF